MKEKTNKDKPKPKHISKKSTTKTKTNKTTNKQCRFKRMNKFEKTDVTNI